MTTKHLAQVVFFILFLLYAISALAGDIAFYDKNGQLIDQAGYEKIVKKRSKQIDKIMEDGYRDNTMKLEDPILLRKKRIEQWKRYREAMEK